MIVQKNFFRVAKWQLTGGLIVALVGYLLSGGYAAAISALIGVGAVMVGSFGATLVVRVEHLQPMVALVNILKAEALKIFIVALLLFIAFKLYSGLVPVALIGGLGVAALLSGVSLGTVDDQNKA